MFMMLNDIANTSILSVRLTLATLKENLPQKQVQNKNTDFFVFTQLPDATPQIQQPIPVQNQPSPNAQLPNASTNTVQHPTGLTTKQVNENIRFLITNLKLELHSSGTYFTSTRKGSNPNDRYYPQLNGTFFVTGTTENKEIIQSTITNFLNGEPVISTSPTTGIPHQHTLLLGQLKAFTQQDGFNFNSNGTLTSPLHKDVTLHRQLDGSLWGSNNTTYKLASNNTSVEQQTKTTPLPFTTFFSQTGIQPLRLANATPKSSQILGAFLRPDDPGMYVLQENGNVFYTGRTTTEGNLGPFIYTFINGTWKIDEALSETARINKAGPSPLSVTLAAQGAYKKTSSIWCNSIGARVAFSKDSGTSWQTPDPLYNWLFEVDINSVTDATIKKEIERRRALFRTIDLTRFPDAQPTNPTEEHAIETLNAYKQIIVQLRTDLKTPSNRARVIKIAELLQQNIEGFPDCNNSSRDNIGARFETDVKYIYTNERLKGSKTILSWANPIFLKLITPHFQGAHNDLSTIIKDASQR